MTVRDDLAAGKYKNKVPFDPPAMEPIDETKTTVARARELKETYAAARIKQRRLWNDGEQEMNELLRADLEYENGVVGHPKADVLWRLVWDHGRSSGYGDIINYYEDFVELLR